MAHIEPVESDLTPEEAWNFFEGQVRERLHMSADEFVCRLQAGEYSSGKNENKEAILLSMIMPKKPTKLGKCLAETNGTR